MFGIYGISDIVSFIDSDITLGVNLRGFSFGKHKGGELRLQYSKSANPNRARGLGAATGGGDRILVILLRETRRKIRWRREFSNSRSFSLGKHKGNPPEAEDFLIPGHLPEGNTKENPPEAGNL